MASNFERKYGKYAIKNLSVYLIVAYIIGYMLQIISPEISEFLAFNPYWIFRGQVWRIFTWILMPPEQLSIFAIIMLLLYYQLGQGLERAWGTYRYNVFIFSGFIFTILGALVLYGILMGVVYFGILPTSAFSEMTAYGISDYTYYFGAVFGSYVSTFYVNMSIFLAFAATYPEEQLLLYFIIPIKIKWMGYLYGAFLLVDIFDAFKNNTTVVAIVITVLIVVSLLNFLIYWLRTRNKSRFNPKQVKRRHEYRQSVRQARPVKHENGALHKCYICGRTELDDPNLTFRYCSKCSGNKEYCQDHLFTHEHK